MGPMKVTPERIPPTQNTMRKAPLMEKAHHGGGRVVDLPKPLLVQRFGGLKGLAQHCGRNVVIMGEDLSVKSRPCVPLVYAPSRSHVGVPH